MDNPLRIVIVGLGRAGTSVGLAAHRAGHDIVGVLGRSNVIPGAATLEAPVLEWGISLPSCDLIIVAVRDDAITEVATLLVPIASTAAASVHLSGLTSVDALDPLRQAGLEIGGFHPLQSMPNPRDGAAALDGASVGITADPPLQGVLEGLAISIGAHPFELLDAQRPLYHAAAAAAANYVLTALGMAERLFAAAGVPFAACRPLVIQIVNNAFDLGPLVSLTGPIARGDVGTVASQLAAVEAFDPDLASDFRALGRATARWAGSGEAMREALG
ncbi:MAG: DUF2520 domain-containing protein [Acidimicrobiia bacterium]|nr:DUF2520 domain-containing protein [Acidimicrobiia bacterium]